MGAPSSVSSPGRWMPETSGNASLDVEFLPELGLERLDAGFSSWLVLLD